MIYFDGSSPKQIVCVSTSFGVYVKTLNEALQLLDLDVEIPRTKSQRAEYVALIYALSKIEDYAHHEIAGDCENVILQIQGINKVKDPTLRILYAKAQKLINTRGLDVSFRHILREDNPAGKRIEGWR